MKRFCLLMFLTIIISAYGMTWEYADFEAGTLTGVTLYDIDGDTNNWEITTINPYAGVYSTRSVSEALDPDNWFVTPQIYAERYSDTDYPHIKFMIGSNDSINFSEHYEVLVSFTNTDTASFVSIYEETLTSSDWKEVDIELMPYFGEFQWEVDMYIAIRHFGSAGQSALLFDDLMIYSKPAFYYEDSIIIEGSIEPYTDFDLRWSIYDRTAYDADWNLTNGYDSVQLHCIITDETGSHAEAAIDIFPSTDLSYDWCYDVTVAGRSMGTFIEYWLVVVDGSGYGVSGESQHFNVEWGEINIDEGFEYGALPPEGWLPAGWSTFQTGDDQGNSWDQPWEVDVVQQNFHGGEYSITSVSQSNLDVWLTDNYLVSPRIRVNGEPSLKYFVNAQTPEGYVEKWSLLISIVDSPGTDIENFTEIYTDSIIAGTSDDMWVEKVMPLNDYTNEYIRIMWKHHYTEVTKFDRYLNIDDISISQPPTVEVGDVGNVSLPDESVTINITATDYSGINNATLYYTIEGEGEVSLVMIDNGDDTFTGIIPAQVLDTKAKWHIAVTDGSAFSNITTTSTYDVIWFTENWLEWGLTPGVYTDPVDGYGTPWIAAMDWNFGKKGYIYLNKIEAGFRDNETVTWKLVEFDDVPTDNVIGTYEGIADFIAGGSEIDIERDSTRIYGHVALCLEIPSGYLWLDESGDKLHAWQYTASQGWRSNSWGAFHIRMYVSNYVGIDNDKFIANTTELCQNYPNPFNPTTSISFFNKETGKVNLTVYNVAGEKVASLVDGNLKSGYHKINFDAARLNSGVYYYTLVTLETKITKKMVLVK